MATTQPTLGHLCGNLTNLILITAFLKLELKVTSLPQDQSPQKWRTLHRNLKFHFSTVFGIFSLFQILKAVNEILKVSWEERFSVWLTRELTYYQIGSRVYIEGIFCKSLDQIYKPVEICNFVLWYHEDNSAYVYYDLTYSNKIAIKRIR